MNRKVLFWVMSLFLLGVNAIAETMHGSTDMDMLIARIIMVVCVVMATYSWKSDAV